MIKRRTQAPMVIVFNRDEAEGLKDTVRHLSRRAEEFGHAMHRSRLRLERNLDEIARPKRLRETKQASGHGNGLKFGFGAAAVFEPDRGQDRIA